MRYHVIRSRKKEHIEKIVLYARDMGFIKQEILDEEIERFKRYWDEYKEDTVIFFDITHNDLAYDHSREVCDECEEVFINLSEGIFSEEDILI